MRGIPIERRSGEDHKRDRWLISYADLVTLLLALFIVLYAASDKERAKQISEAFSSQNPSGSGILPASKSEADTRDRYEQRLLEDAAMIRNGQIRRSPDGIVISMTEAGLFAPGDAALSPQANEMVAEIAKVIADADTSVRIEGHTDPTPIATGRYRSNWELSTARAASVLAALASDGIQPERLSAAGYAEFRPVADNATPDGRALNRRVDVVLLTKR